MTGSSLKSTSLAIVCILLAAIGGAAADTVVPLQAADWTDYQIIMWQSQTASGYRALQSIGVNAAMMHADRESPQTLPSDELGPLLDANMRWYVENMATDFYSAYHRYFVDRPVNWRFLEVQKLYQANPTDPAALIRDPSLSDPAWLEKISQRVREIVAANRRYHPLFYNLADEAGIADLNAYWDFDFSPTSLAAMRLWLKRRYPDLASLNAEWGTRFDHWDEIVPMTTAAAMARTDGNFAAWGDFKAFMDAAFADAFAAGRDAVHAADPSALAGLEGGQKLGWGGYNYETLARAVDVMETDSRLLDLVHALNPRLRPVTTSFGSGAGEEHYIWRALFAGSRGIIIWDSKHNFIAADGTLGPRGRRAAPYYTELRGGLGALVNNGRTVAGPVAILYSPASLRTQWLLDFQGKGDAWTKRDADTEDREDGTVRAAMDSFARGLEQLGYLPGYVSSAMVEDGALARGGFRVLILPHTVALSRKEARAIGDFAARGGTVIADSEPGLYDEHSKKLAAPLLATLFGPGAGRGQRIVLGTPLHDDASDPDSRLADGDLARLRDVLARAGVRPSVTLVDAAGAAPADVAVREFRDGDVVLLALQRDLRPGAEAAPEHATLRLPRPAFVYDVRRKMFLGRTRAVALALDAVEPTVLALAPAALPAPELSVPPRARAGDKIVLRLGLTGHSPADFHVLHLEVTDASGRAVRPFTENVVLRGGGVMREIVLAADAHPGQWHVTIGDVLSGRQAKAPLPVTAR